MPVKMTVRVSGMIVHEPRDALRHGRAPVLELVRLVADDEVWVCFLERLSTRDAP